MARPRSPDSEIVSAQLNSVEHAAVAAFARDHGLCMSAAIGQLVRIGFRESIGARRPLEPVLAPNEWDGCDLSVSFTRADWACAEAVLALIQSYSIPPLEEQH
jgi:hypothetical protein